MFKTMLFAVLVSVVGCAGQVGTQPFEHEDQAAQAATTKKAWYQGAWAMWEADMPCGAQAWCTVTNGSVILMGVQPNGRFRCEANINPGQTLEMTLSCP